MSRPTITTTTLQLHRLSAQMKALLALTGAAFGPHERIKATVVLARVHAVLAKLEAEDTEVADMRMELVLKVRAYERRYGGFYGTGF